MRLKLITLSLLTSISIASAQDGVWQGRGRIAVSSDGNEHDHDDWGATALTLALVGSSGLQDQLCLYTYSDHIWGSNQNHPSQEIGKSAYEQMRESALRGAEHFGFDKSRFVCAVDNAEVAYERMKEQINLSTEENPLIIVAGGPMQVVGEAINRANRNCLKYVSLITHSQWNNNHGADTRIGKSDRHNELGWTFDQIEGIQSRYGLRCVRIIDQNGNSTREGLKTNRERFDWLLSSSKLRRGGKFDAAAWDWLYGRLETFGEIKPKFIDTFDVSDAGMMLYVLSGKEDNRASDVRTILENGICR